MFGLPKEKGCAAYSRPHLITEAFDHLKDDEHRCCSGTGAFTSLLGVQPWYTSFKAVTIERGHDGGSSRNVSRNMQYIILLLHRLVRRL